MPQSIHSPVEMDACSVRGRSNEGIACDKATPANRTSLCNANPHYDAFKRWKLVKLWLRFGLHSWHSRAVAAAPSLPPSPASIDSLKPSPPPSSPPDTHDVQEVYQPIQVLGKGAFGTVTLSRKASTNTLVAIKSIDKSKMCEEESVRLLTERAVLSTTQHPFLIYLDAAFESPTHYHFVLEYCPGGDLYSLLECHHHLDAALTTFYTASMLSALLYLHQVCGIAYRDLKPENVLLDAKGFIRLSDFGLAKTNMIPSSITHSFCGSVDYMAPEVILGCGYGLAADVWSLGCVVFELLTGLPPFYTTAGRRALFDRICSGHVMYPDDMPVEACTFIAHCLQLDPQKRWTIRRLLDHPFMASVDWYQLGIQQVPVPYVPNLDHMEDTQHFGNQFKSVPVPHDKLMRRTRSDSDASGDFSAFDWCRDTCRQSTRAVPTSAV
ncbi:AGC/AKT protein kinase [Aphanomyces invadans]|uniref:AGC/AKT protein kinase n=1 Tax=Aphanomyces invadans TaxID=157072 RepID=A0A024TU78_9STRA|nr:AGC/AKT protein kinase [Aphanomyces invadans]ETV97186.1 AGC/AKT protein kinase [Aphanomyces invadans]|eukprot:XP_008874432.1 AGC/AKT protein kinase [Aphanomyces invadans]